MKPPGAEERQDPDPDNKIVRTWRPWRLGGCLRHPHRRWRFAAPARARPGGGDERGGARALRTRARALRREGLRGRDPRARRGLRAGSAARVSLRRSAGSPPGRRLQERGAALQEVPRQRARRRAGQRRAHRARALRRADGGRAGTDRASSDGGAAAATSSPVPAPRTAAPASPWYNDTAGGVLLGAGVAALAVGAGFSFAALSARDDAEPEARRPIPTTRRAGRRRRVDRTSRSAHSSLEPR